MRKTLQKSAIILRPANVTHYGILSADDFDHHYDLRCYEPPEDLKPFVVHLWVQRKRTDQTSVIPIEVQTGPNTYIFINRDESIIHGIFSDRFRYKPHEYEVYAGVKFKPGGLRAFWDQSMSRLAEQTMPASALFPGIDALIGQDIDQMGDEEIIAGLTAVLRAKKPTIDKNLQAITQVMEHIQTDESLETIIDLGRAVNKSERTLRLLFREYVGVPVKWVLMRRRFIDAVKQASATPANWATIAASFGYSNQSHFSREFKHITHIPPSTYRKTK